MRPPQLTSRRGYSAEDVAILWGLPVAVPQQWLDDGTLVRNAYEVVTRVELLAFLNSTQGQALLRSARGA